MSTLELQEKLIEKIKITQNDVLLQDVYRLLEMEENINDVYTINAEQKAILEKSLKEIEEGEFSTDEAVQKETSEWLRK